MAIPGNPSARLTQHLKLITGRRLLRFSILKETPTAPLRRPWNPLCPAGALMPRIDDYKQARELGVKQLLEKSPDLVARLSGADMRRDKEGEMSLSLNFQNQKVAVTWPDFRIQNEKSQEELPIQQQILLLHYFHGAWTSNGAAPEGEWISFQEVPDGRFYLDAFNKRAKIPLVQAFGGKPELMVKLAVEVYGAEPFDQGDFSVVIKALPLVPVALILWKGDEEFPAEGTLLFDKTVSKILSAEDIAWLAGMVVYPLIGMAKQEI
jgi:hypothetical protein